MGRLHHLPEGVLEESPVLPVRFIKSDTAIDASRRTDETPYVGLFNLFKIGIGPPSSHTSGPMTAAANFMHALSVASVESIRFTLFGSLARLAVFDELRENAK